MKRLAVSLFLSVFFFLPLLASAAVTVRISSSPAYPVPGLPATLTANTNSKNESFLYQWVVNGTAYTEGVDRSSITLVPGKTGSEILVDVALINSGGTIVGTDSYTIRPGSVDLIWEGATFVPPFYRGKSYPNGDSLITLQAIPHISAGEGEIPASDLMYSWSADGRTLPSISGYGKSSVSIRPTSFRPITTVTVIVTSRDGYSAGKATATIPIATPKLVVYEDRPLTGVSTNSAVNASLPFTGEEMTFWAVPFFVIDPTKMTFSWTAGGQAFANDPATPSTATFRKSGGGTGASTIGVTVGQKNHIFENTSKTFTLSFE